MNNRKSKVEGDYHINLQGGRQSFRQYGVRNEEGNHREEAEGQQGDDNHPDGFTGSEFRGVGILCSSGSIL